ncbi:MAG: U32 family peptidase [Verrucomicrobia bacterium]|nr:U32 family peptidase [Verrucomicrobiota bacterium]
MSAPELLSPAGDWECLRAAVANGANAVYFGLPKFNARLRAHNFTLEELPEVMEYLHERNVRGYITFNTLIFTDELTEAAAQLEAITAAGADAIIVQDLGLVRLAQHLVPQLELHASTQMTITSPEGLELMRQSGITRAVVARELSLGELDRFKAVDVPIETFVHGALCVAYSGQCLTSESLGQRSANRGECAQACRLPYDLMVDGQKHELGDQRYLLSPQDLAGLDEIPQLVSLGIRAFKIEGRLKSPEYVAAVTKVYRKAIDQAVRAPDFAPSSSLREATSGKPGSPKTPGTEEAAAGDRYALEMTFSRGLYSGWLHGVNHQRLVDGRFGKKRGAYVGEVTQVGKNFVEILSRIPVRPGDGLVFANGGDTEQEEGGRVYEVDGAKFFFGNNEIDFSRVTVGDRVWKTDDPALNKALRQTFARDLQKSTLPVSMIASGKCGLPLRLKVVCSDVTVEAESSQVLQPARSAPLTAVGVRELLSRLGGTRFHAEKIEIALDGGLFMTAGAVNQLRREVMEALEAKIPERGQERPVATHSRASTKIEWPLRSAEEAVIAQPELVVLCRTIPQLEATISLGVRTIYVDFEDIRRYSEAVEIAASYAQLFLATPRIQKPGEQGFFRLIENARPAGVLIRNLGAIAHFRGRGLCLRGDFSLNVANPLAAAFLVEQGLDRLTVSYDLTFEQILALLAYSPSDRYELTLHQHMPMFHMEHCVFAAFLSNGTDYTNCGRPCDRHRVEVRDRVGLTHLVKADVGCRNTVFNARAQTGAQYFVRLQRAGLRYFRIELLDEDRENARRLISLYLRLLEGSRSGDEVWHELKADSRLGVTHGTLNNAENAATERERVRTHRKLVK